MAPPAKSAPSRQPLESPDDHTSTTTSGEITQSLLGEANHDETANGTGGQRRRGRPPIYQTSAASTEEPGPGHQAPSQQISDNTVSSVGVLGGCLLRARLSGPLPTNTRSRSSSPQTDDDTTKSSPAGGKLSSAYHYAASRTRQNQAIRLPEGPNLTAEQLKLIESQFKVSGGPED